MRRLFLASAKVETVMKYATDQRCIASFTAGKYLAGRGVAMKDFNSYGARRPTCASRT
ncbi:MAG TPA: hypothetical protein VMV48_02335 [Gallionellaceae bacterium]|nr:hypothetical protein [Gallionellaceae bacterium]